MARAEYARASWSTLTVVAPVKDSPGESLYVMGIDFLDDGFFRSYEGVDRDVGKLNDDLEFLNSTDRILVGERFAKSKGLRSTEWFVFECSGTAAGQLTAWSLLVHGATLSVVGFTMDKVEVRLSNLMAFDARALGNWGCPPEYYPAALDLVLDGAVRLAPFVETHPLERINEVFHAVHAREITRRAVMVP